MFKKSSIAALALSLSFTASANWGISTGFANFSADAVGEDLSFDVVYGSLTYEYKFDDSQFSLVPELRAGIGISDDAVDTNIGRIFVELDTFYALSFKGQYSFNESAYVFALPSYANVKSTATVDSTSVSDDEWEFGYGIGAGYALNDKAKVELSFEQYDDTDVLSVSLQMKF
ncbi:outer membrane beta-barrel protein [Thalassotalea euphylliae]|uniref:Porin family protein n=1 Tax=Thalassotalea euphylliae TaxID=1655234 RepID=A0A3E0UHZ2_9GAMM|nr:outer membrane beta-barrel protein [Thalassotalea euphylliae]REL36499.1 porin family protein [Thalassotalea euphylliae]